jgi:hypothetical protein
MFLKNKQKIIAAIFIFLAFFFFILSFFKFQESRNISWQENLDLNNQEEGSQKIIFESFELNEQENFSNTKPENIPVKTKYSNLEIEDFSESDLFTFQIENIEFKFSFLPEETLYSSMVKMKNQDLITFSGKEFSGLGFFITEINGVSQNPQKGLYWKYFINEKPANIGISSYVLKRGDKISWKLTDE